MRNPNGYGSVYKLKGHRRRPYVARKTAGFDDKKHPIYNIIGYYATRQEAMIALADFNSDPYDVNRAKITFRELFEEWKVNILPSIGKSLQGSLLAAYGYCTALDDKPYKSLRRMHMQKCIDECNRSQSTQGAIRLLFVKLDAYAYDLDIIKKQYSQLLTTSETEPQRQSVPFTNEEIKIMWEHEEECANVLFLLYTGMRLTEAATLPTSAINDGLIRWGIKTKAGKDRIIPIHSKIKHIVDARMNNELLIGYGKMSGRNLYNGFIKIMKKYGMSHHPHDCRHTFRSELDRRDANKVSIDLLLGHSSGSVGERVYTHKTVEELKEAIEKITYGLDEKSTQNQKNR